MLARLPQEGILHSAMDQPQLACIVDIEADLSANRLYLIGRLADGRSFAAQDSTWKPRLLLRVSDIDQACSLGLFSQISHGLIGSTGLMSMGGEALGAIELAHLRDFKPCIQALEHAGIPLWEADRSLGVLWSRDHGLGSTVLISGKIQPGRQVDVIVHQAKFQAAKPENPVGLRLLSFDFETDEESQAILTAGLACEDVREVHQLCHPGAELPVLPPGHPQSALNLIWHTTERSLISAFMRRVAELDPDVLTGWNIIDFDLKRLAERCTALGITLRLGRNRGSTRYYTGTDGRSSALHATGRQVLDAMRVVRSSPEHFDDLSLETVAQKVLGRGKLLREEGDEKLARLKALYKNSPLEFAAYCLEDAKLVLEILGHTGLFDLTLRRAMLTGTRLDIAWTSIASFEQLYALELRQRSLVEPRKETSRLAGSPGGTVIEPRPVLGTMVLVFDYRSLYPSIIRTLNIDPLAFQEARGLPDAQCLIAPNGARFSRERGILPDFTDGCFASRTAALERGDDTAAYVYKILMNSFYGVLGAEGCRYGRRELAGAITSTGSWCLMFARDFIEAQGYGVLYGDTDSVFVASPLPSTATYTDCRVWAEELLLGLNAALAQAIEERWHTPSFISLRFDKAYRRFLIPRIRFGGGHDDGTEERGRAKGYAGLQIKSDGTETVDIKGMEAVRSDVTPLARRVQTELLGLVFASQAENCSAEATAYLLTLKKLLLAGRLDEELIYTRRLRQSPDSYVKNTPPHVRAARLAGITGRGRVRYVYTMAGPEPVGRLSARIDYIHYLDSQVLPLARSIGQQAGFDPDGILGAGGQYELF